MPLKFLHIILVVILLASCSKESTNFLPNANNPLNDTTWQENTSTNNIVFPDLANEPLVDTIISSAENTIKINDSLGLYFPANSILNANKQPVAAGSKIVVTINIFTNKEQFIRNAISTNSYLQLMNLYCHFKIQLKTLFGESVFWNEAKHAQIKLIANNSQLQLFSNLKGFTSNEIKYNNSNWITHFLPFPNAGFSVIPINNSRQEFAFITSSIQNIGFAKLLDTAGLKMARTNVILPPNFTNKNTQCFIVFKNSNTVLQLFSTPTLKYFYGLHIPVNTTAILLSISKISNDYYLGSNTAYSFNGNPIKLTPAKITKPQLLKKLAAFN